MLATVAATYGCFLFAYLVAQGILRFALSNGRRPSEYAARLVSILHSTVACALASFALAGQLRAVGAHGSIEAHLEALGASACSAVTPVEGVVLLHSAAYFTVDLGAMCLFDTFDRVFVLHHVGAIAGLLWPLLLSGKCGALIVSILLVLELTNPLQHARWLLVHEWLRVAPISSAASTDCVPVEDGDLKEVATDSPVLESTLRALAAWCGDAFLVSFTLARAVIGPVLIYVAFHTPDVPMVMCLLGCAFFIGSMLELHRLMSLRFRLHDPTWVC